MSIAPRLRVDHVVISVANWERSNRFYENVLGAEVDQLDDAFARYRFGDWQLNVHGPKFAGLKRAGAGHPR
jgi:catechol 2,3-dioxygenase-like lactoylglutathione lyase family enzyme